MTEAQGKPARRGRPRLIAVGLLALLLLLAAGAAGGYLWLQDLFHAPGPGQSTVRFEVAPGSSVRSMLAQLESTGNVRDARAVGWYLRLRGLRPRVQAGIYEIPAGASAAQILELFEEGRVVLEQLTVVEGATFADFRAQLAQQPHVTHTLTGKSDTEVMRLLGHPGMAAEGEFFPDTYRFAAGTSDVAILAMAHEAMQRVLTNAWAARQPGLPLASDYQALILASMIEKEAALQSERALIAGVFVNRLRKGMRLQSDPTVVYGLGARYDGTIHTRDLATDTLYNTYTRDGLPPTPIALPGREAIQAAVQPAETAALYFVATGLNDGAHHFSATLEEHNSAVQSYLQRLRSEQRRAPSRSPTPAAAAAAPASPAPAAATQPQTHP